MDKLTSLKDQLKQLETGLHPEYMRRIRRLEQIYDDRLMLDEAFLAFEVLQLLYCLLFICILKLLIIQFTYIID